MTMKTFQKLSLLAIAASLALPVMATSASAAGGTPATRETTTGSSHKSPSYKPYSPGSTSYGSYDYSAGASSYGSYYQDPCATQNCWQAAPSYSVPYYPNVPYEFPGGDLQTYPEMNRNVDPYFYYPALMD
jgi:hypothetical protein